MCGFAGYLTFSNRYDSSVITSMANVLEKRGPDDSGVELFNEAGFQLALGHRRLSIIDISTLGHQPMNYKHWWIAYNGEVYNFDNIKTELSNLGHVFKSSSDTEVILHAFDEWGIDAIHKFIGMFAFVIYNQKNQELTLVRDRVGVKPLYVYQDDNTLMFASELKSFLEYPEFNKSINHDAAYQFFKYGFIHAPNTIYKNATKLNPGSYLTYNIKTRDIRQKSYWNILDFYKKPTLQVSYEDAKSHIKQLMQDAFKLRMVSDVPVGVFLSGGYDSALVTGVLQSEMQSKLKTFTIGFDNKAYDESAYAERVADHLGTEQHTFICSDEEALDIIPKLASYYDEPFADPSVVPTMLLSEKTREKVTVSLSADGGDELFFGYNRYSKIHRYYGRLKKLSVLGFALGLMSKFKKKNTIKKPLYAHNVFKKNSIQQFLDSVLQKYKDSYLKTVVLKGRPIKTNFDKSYTGVFKFKKLLAIDATTYMPDDILVKVDRATMAYSLEGREPLLDHRIIEYAAQLPFEYLYDTGTKSKKHILKGICHDYIPKAIMDRKKVGFTPPLAEWLRKDLKAFVIKTLDAKELEKHGFLNINKFQSELDRFLKGDNRYYDLVWNALVFQLWYKKWIENE
ncbi:asparagine synthase (glutamine-hydrolyzing) [Winogradskyella sp.]|uniref:asparagine synthase (glutamine-hydrolyzing) n=1 Tax=Winogradskyella sp. TaxID=1883156 RepID=UPI00260B18A1|nr:asparagine synthase (glutamine-hydrolyzing) [Winogradskyella sp.]